jgi:organic hydroperoxide reductase OsmC/OhrA
MSTCTSHTLWLRGEIDAMHHAAHADCFIANSVKTQVLVEPVYGALG